MPDTELLARYNYDEFVPHKFKPWMNFDASPALGEPGPDFPLWDLQKSQTSLRQIVTQNIYTIVEFGSFIWPYCGMAAPSMNKIADQYSKQGVGSIFIYTNEAHPGENYPHLTSLDQKFTHAAALRDVLDVTGPIFVDSLDGACHRAYGSMPNMSWIFNRSAIPIYKSDWTDSHSVQNAIEYFLQ